MAVVAGLIRARRNKTGPALPAARALPVRVVADPLSADSESVRAGGACHDLAIDRVEAVVSGHVDPVPRDDQREHATNARPSALAEAMRECAGPSTRPRMPFLGHAAAAQS